VADPIRSVDDLPGVIPVFPLDGALLLPHGQLPLNIFEPRYLNMIDDAMAADRIIGMVQTRGGDPARPNLQAIGCAGRITAFTETRDGRYLITLTGAARFRLGEELPAQTPYRRVRADFADFAADLDALGLKDAYDRERLLEALKAYLAHRGLAVDWEAAQEAPTAALVNSLCSALPFDPAEKQALLEASDPTARGQALIALLEIDGVGDEDAPPSLQ
jgi:Lon protease-like protein